MRSKPSDGRELVELLEAALDEQAGLASSGDSSRADVVVGQVLDTHHPHLPGRVLVRWLAEQGEVDRWVHAERHLRLRKGDRVLLTLPRGFAQWVVTGALGGAVNEAVDPETAARATAEEACNGEAPLQLRLSPGEAVEIISHNGKILLVIQQGAEGPVLQLGSGNVELSSERTLRLTADTIELAAGQGGVDVRTEGETLVRARTIRLN